MRYQQGVYVGDNVNENYGNFSDFSPTRRCKLPSAKTWGK